MSILAKALTACLLLGAAVLGRADVDARRYHHFTRAALKDEIKSLPGLASAPNFRMFSGYIDVSAEKDGSKQMFYWFVESQKSPEHDPVLLWTNGGPGCSGLGGFMTEMGPFRPTKSGNDTALKDNEFAWNKIANVVFIEQPVGVGFSLAPKGMAYGDAQAAEDNARFVSGFFEKFANFKSNKFFITSESYGGHYMPTLARQLLQGGQKLNGVAVGNPLTYMPYRNYGQYGTAYGHQLLPKPLWDQYTTAGCKDSFPPSDECNNIENQMMQILSGFDPYALDFPTCNVKSLASGREERFMMARTISGGKYFPEDYEPCASNWGNEYLNRDDVRAAAHVDPRAPTWAMCNGAINMGYNKTDTNAPMMPVWKDVLALAQGKDFKAMVYSGDDDSICATLGTQQWIWNMGLKTTEKWSPWMFSTPDDGPQVAGFVTKFDGGLSFATIHGAGHMCPQTRPAQSLELIGTFLSDAW